MENDLISRSALLRDPYFQEDRFPESHLLRMAIKEAHAIDPESLRPKGRWLESEDYMFCSQCGMQWNYCDNDTQDFEFCPNCGAKMRRSKMSKAPAVDAVPVEKLGKWGKLFIPYKGCPRGPVGRMGQPATLEDEALHWGVITDVDGGRWVPVAEGVLRELISKANATTPSFLKEEG